MLSQRKNIRWNEEWIEWKFPALSQYLIISHPHVLIHASQCTQESLCFSTHTHKSPLHMAYQYLHFHPQPQTREELYSISNGCSWIILFSSIFPLPFPSTAKNTAMGTKKWMCCMCVRVLLSAERVYGRTYVHYYWTRLFMVSFGLSLSLSPSACLNWKWNFVNGNYT